MTAKKFFGLLAAVTLAISCNPSHAQSPPAPPTTLWSFLGIPQTAARLKDSLSNHFGNHPGLERKPPLTALADPANLESDIPAIKEAAKVKQAEDMAPQKIKAIKYLGEIGCGCYDKDGAITKALIASMEDCTEEVRLAAVKAIKEGAEGPCCQYCNQRSCCSPEVTEALAKLAYEMNDEGCPVEPSERVRQAAVEALTACCPSQQYAPEPAPVPVEGSDDSVPVEGEDSLLEEPPMPTPDMDARRSLRGTSALPASMQRSSASGHPEPTLADPLSTVAQRQQAVVFVDREKKIARLHLPRDEMQVEQGATFQVFQPVSGKGYKLIGEFSVLKAGKDQATIKPIGDWDVAAITRDCVIVGP